MSTKAEMLGSPDDSLFDALTMPLFAQAAASKPTPVLASVGHPERSHGMIEGIKPYAEYKESGLPWAPRVPAHWSLIPNRAVLRKRKILVGGNHKNFQLLSLTKGGVIVRDISTGKGKFSSDMGTSQEVRKGDFVFCLFDVPETPRTVGLSPHDGMITGAYTVFESRKLPTAGVRYLERFYLAMDDQKLLSPLYSGLRHTIPPPRFLGTKTPQPPPDEQAAIVRFLDYANRKIDGFIRTKRKLIGLLNEQKRAIIHRAVTRGLHPDVPLKPSGIPWLGDIPKHWAVSRVKNEFKCLNPQRIPLSSTQRGAMTARIYDYYGASGIIDKVENFIFDDDLLLIAEDGANLVLRNLPLAIIAKGKFWVNNHAHILKPKRGNLEYLAGFMETLNYQPWISGAAQPKLTKDRIMGIAIAVAPVSEQTAIVEYFTQSTSPLRAAIARTQREIALMQEYRTRLTADIVTGKLDVREAVTKLPDLPAEPIAEPIADDVPDEIETEGSTHEEN